jgi:hypothetical protein
MLGTSAAASRILPSPSSPDPLGLVGQPKTGAMALERTGAAVALEPEKTQETGPQAGCQRQHLRRATGEVQEPCSDPRLHPRSDSQQPASQVVDAGGRIYSKVPGVARGRVDNRS